MDVARAGWCKVRRGAAGLVLWASVAGAAHAQGEYRMGPGDTVHVTVYQEPSLAGELVVSDACTITLGLIGRVDVCGHTISEVEQEVTARYADGYLVDPHVAVRVERFHSQRVDVLGEVGKPGPQYLEGATSLVELISMAGGPAADNVVKVDIVRRDGTTTTYDLNRLPSDGPVFVGAGDQVFLRPGQVVYVEGQIARPGTVTLVPGLTVTQALALAGGPTEFGRLRRVQVNRADGMKLRVNVVRVHRGVDEDVELQADDHLIVPQSAF